MACHLSLGWRVPKNILDLSPAFRNLTNGRTVHLKTDSDAFIEEIRVLTGAGHGTKIRAELKSLATAHPKDGWDATEKRLEDAGVFA